MDDHDRTPGPFFLLSNGWLLGWMPRHCDDMAVQLRWWAIYSAWIKYQGNFDTVCTHIMNLIFSALFTLFFATGVMAEEKKGTDPEVLIIFLFCGTLLGAVTTHFLSRYAPNVPYTVVVFLEGIAIAAICDNVELGNFKDSVDDWADIDAELILFLFLPVLIFGEAMSLKWHHVKGVFSQSLLLAGPGVGLGAILMASFAKFALPYNWSWNLCMVFGSILAATDPVAVVALLKNAGASPKLTILIIGESLMNDGTAMVLFNLFFNMMQGDTYDFGGIVVYFVQMALGAPLLGVAFGLVTVYLMRLADRTMSHDDVTVQIALTFCCAYLVFFTAEYECEISGVLACVGAGLMLAWKAPPLVLDPETMHHVWGMVEWVANTIIFMLAGLIIGQESVNKVQAMDWAYLIVLYIMLSLFRCVIVFVLYPLLSTTGLKCSRKDAIFVSWAGLRGALAMSLALLVKKSNDINISDVDSDRVFFFVGGIAAITILVNAVFASTILDMLGLLSSEESPDKMMVLKQVQKRLRKKTVDLVMSLSKEMNIKEPSDVIMHNSLLKNYIKRTNSNSGIDVDEVDWITDAMRNVSGVGPNALSQQLSMSKNPIAFYNAYGFEKSGRSMLSQDSNSGHLPRALSRASEWLLHGNRDQDGIFSDLQAYIRAVFLEIVRVQYWQHIEAGKLPRESYATQSLLYSIDIALDRKQEPLVDYSYLEQEFRTAAWQIEALSYIPECTPLLGHLHDVLAARNEKREIYMLSSFIEAHETAQVKIVTFLGHTLSAVGQDEDAEESELTPEERIILKESREVVKLASERLKRIDNEIIRGVMSKQAALILLTRQREYIETMIHDGLLSDKDGDVFYDKFRSDEAAIRAARREDFKRHVEASMVKRTTMSSMGEAQMASAISAGHYTSKQSDSDVLRPLIDSSNDKMGNDPSISFSFRGGKNDAFRGKF